MNEQEKENKIEKIYEVMKKNELTSEEKQFVLNELNSILSEHPDDTDALFWLGMYYQIEEDYETAISYYKKMIDANPDGDKVDNAYECIKICDEFQKFNKEFETFNNENSYSESFLGKAPNMLTKLSPTWLFVIKLIILFAFIFIYCPGIFLEINDKKIIKNTNYKDIKQQIQPSFNTSTENSEEYQTLRVNPTSSYNYYSKRDIYNLRKRYVQTSLFAKENYEPNENVFGSIADNKPWLNLNPCSKLNYNGDYHESIEGDSRLSTQINNPNALVGLNLVVSPWEYDINAEFCNTELGHFIPTSLNYNKKENLIIATYKVPSNYTEYRAKLNNITYGYPIQLSGINALDFGYNYVYALETNGINMMYPESSNMTSDVQIFRNYIHLGGSCRYAGGCNNISPLQNNLMFYVTRLPADITLKLWKKEPLNKNIKADFYYKIIIND